MLVNSNILITGGSGFFGRAFAREVLKQGAKRVCIYSRSEYQQAMMREDFKNDSRLRWFIGDIRDLDRLKTAMEEVEIVVHAAALKRIEVGAYNPDEMVKTNVTGTMNVIEACKYASVDQAVLLSTDKAYQPVSAYGQSKAIAESLFLASNNKYSSHGPKFSVTRYGNVANSTGSVIPTWKLILKTCDTVTVTDPDATRFYMTEAEAVELVIDTIESIYPPRVVVPKLPAYRLGDLAEAMGAKMNIIGMKEWEKKHESMSDTQHSNTARRMTINELREAVK